MAEKQKESSSSAKSKEKTALLADLDIGKDFLTSWKSMSASEDDQMDFDFSTVAKGNKKAFKFDMDDFKLDDVDGFGKLSSFKVDISDLDVSSPVKKAGKPSGKSKEVSAEIKKGKSNQSTFQFDFDGFDDFGFGPSLGKIAKQTKANQDAERSSSLSGSLGFRINIKETIGASEGETTSKFNIQLGGEPNSSSKETSQTSLTGVHFPSKSEISKDQATSLGVTTSPQKLISNSTQETNQDSCPKERITLQEPYKEACQNLSVQSVSENLSTQTACNSKEEVGCLARKESTNTGGEQSLFDEKTDFGFNCGNLQLNKFPVDMACSQSNNGENSQFSGDNPVRIDNKDDVEPAQSDSQFEQTSTTSVSKKMLHETETSGETMDVTSELVVMQSNSESTGDKQIPDSKRVTEVIRSKYFKGSDEAKLQLQQSSVSQIQIAISNSKRIETSQLSPAHEGATMGDKANAMPDKEISPNIRSESLKGLNKTKSQPQQASLSEVKVGTIGSQKIISSQLSTADERKLDNKYAQSGSKLVSLPRPSALPKEQTNVDSVEIRSQGSPSNLISNRGGFSPYDTKGILTNRSRLHDMDVAKGGPVSKGSENKDLNSYRKLDNKDAQTGRKSVVLLKAIPREQIEGDSVQTRSQGSPKDLDSNRGGYISDNTGRTLSGTSRLHDKDAGKGEIVLHGSVKNINSHVQPSSSNEQTNKSASLLGINPRLPVSGVTSLRDKIISSENKKVSDIKDGIRTSVLSNMNNMRTMETIHSPSNSTLQKDTKVLTNSGQGVDLKENTGSRMVHPADTRKQESSSPTLKRKKIEESSANLLLLKPTKRLAVSPSGNRNFSESSEKIVYKENISDGHTENGLNDSQGSCLHIPQKVDINELETPIAMDSDTTVENAQACAKELDDLVNMLKKKHEEAKEILVRAVVNNNKLLLLNHPIYDEKFRLTEKFAALLLSK